MLLFVTVIYFHMLFLCFLCLLVSSFSLSFCLFFFCPFSFLYLICLHLLLLHLILQFLYIFFLFMPIPALFAIHLNSFFVTLHIPFPNLSPFKGCSVFLVFIYFFLYFVLSLLVFFFSFFLSTIFALFYILCSIRICSANLFY
jgi:hypothetical protein